MRLQVNRVAHPVTVLGPGRRLGLWVQGCRLHCPGCGSIDTWDPHGGLPVDTVTFATDLADLVTEHQLTGLTITGGEPTEQADALADVVTRLHGALHARPSSGDRPEFDVLVFSGLATRAAARRAPALWAVADAAVCGPYRPDRPSADPLIASANQELVKLTPLGRSRYADLGAGGPSLQAHVGDGEITLVGLPKPGDLTRLEAALRARGVSMEGRSWQTS